MKKITAEILAGKGVVGLADTPGLTKEEMQRKMDEIGKDVLVPAYNELVEELMGEGGAAAIGYAPNANLPGAENVQQAVDQTVEKISEQEKDLKQYVDDTLQAIGAADMLSAVYDPQGKRQDIFAYADEAAEAAKEEAEETAKAEAESTIGKMLVLTYGKAETTHTLTGLSGAAGTLSCVFTASADYMKGDTFTVDGESYTVKQQNGEEAGDKLFAAGAVVSCIIDTAGKTVNFKSGGGGSSDAEKSMYVTVKCNQSSKNEQTISVDGEVTNILLKGKSQTKYSNLTELDWATGNFDDRTILSGEGSIGLTHSRYGAMGGASLSGNVVTITANLGYYSAQDADVYNIVQCCIYYK